jgi:hypothetical protein
MLVYPVIHMESNHQQQQGSTHPRYYEPEYAINKMSKVIEIIETSDKYATSKYMRPK